MGTCRARPLRHPIIFHDLIFTTRNFKLAFHLLELQFAALRPPALSSTPLSISLSVRSPSFHPLPMCCSIPFRRSGRSVTSQSVLVVLRLYRLYYVSSCPFVASTVRCLVPRRMKSAKGTQRECDEKANVRMCRSRNHLIVL